jgi:hypothetical protein
MRYLLSCVKICKQRTVNVTEKIVITVLKEYKVKYTYSTYSRCGPGSSVSIVTRYGLGGTGIESGWGVSATFQTEPGDHPASYTMGTGSFPGGKAAGAWR